MNAQQDANGDGQNERQERPVLELVKPVCPACGGIKFTAGGTTPNGDGTYRRYSQCKECFLPVYILILYGDRDS